MTQYVKLNPQEQTYGQKNLLFAQASFLVMFQRLQNFKKLRIEELMLKLLLKKKITEARESLASLNSILPPTPIKKERKPKMAEETIVEEIIEEKPKARTLEDEIEEIRQKIARLS